MFGYRPTTRTTPTRRDRDDEEEGGLRPRVTLRTHDQGVWIDAERNEIDAEEQIEQYSRIRKFNRNCTRDRPLVFEAVVKKCSVKKNINDAIDEFDVSEARRKAKRRCACGQTTMVYHIATNRYTFNRILVGSCCVTEFHVAKKEPNDYKVGNFVVNDSDAESSDCEPSDYEN